MSPDEIKARMAAVAAFAKSMFPDMGQVDTTIWIHGATEQAFNDVASVQNDVAIFHTYEDYASAEVQDYGAHWALYAFMPIASVRRPPVGFVPPAPEPPAPVTVTPPVPSLPNLRDLDPTSDAAIRFSLLEMD